MHQPQKNIGSPLRRGYRYSFNGKEKIDEVAGSGNSIDFGARIYDARVGRWLSRDPLEARYSDISPYVFVANCVLFFVDHYGRSIDPSEVAATDKAKYDAAVKTMKSYPLLEYNYQILASYNNMPKTKLKKNSQATAAFYLEVSVRTMTKEDIKQTNGMAAGFSTEISENTKKHYWKGELVHEYFTTEISINSSNMNYGVIAEEFLHAGQKLFYKENELDMPNEISIELEAKVIKIYSIWEQNQDLAAGDLYNKMVGLGILDYELDIIFNWTDTKDANGNVIRKVEFDKSVLRYFELGGDVAFSDFQAVSAALTKAAKELEKTYQNKPDFKANQKIDTSFKFFSHLKNKTKN